MVNLVTGHGQEDQAPDWKALIQPGQTIVVYMGLSALPELSAGYIAAGGDPAMPAAIVENGTRPGPRIIAAKLGQPSLIVIGTVVTLRGELSWFETPGPG